MKIKLSRAQIRLLRVLLFFTVLTGGILCLIGANHAFFQALSWRLAIVIDVVFAACLAFFLKILMIRRKPTKVPVLMYHRVADYFDVNIWKELVIPVSLFRRQLSYLKKRGYTTLFLKDLVTLLESHESLPPNPICLTFDDGFLDNWTVVFPLLRRFGMKGTFFITTAFVEPGRELRPTLDERIDQPNRRNAVDVNGYMSWSELTTMLSSGLVEIQSHSVTHSWCFTGPRIIDFYSPGNSYPWVVWNEKPERCYDWLRDAELEADILGTPIYENGRNLVSRKYIGDPRLKNFLCDHVRRNGGTDLFTRAGWFDELRRIGEEWKEKNGSAGHHEEESEFRGRIYNELKESREVLEKNLNITVDVFCWPSEVHTSEGREMALNEARYAATTGGEGFNTVGGDPSLISRTFIGSFFSRTGFDVLDMVVFILKIKLQEGNYFCYIPLMPLYFLKFTYMSVSFLGRRFSNSGRRTA